MNEPAKTILQNINDDNSNRIGLFGLSGWKKWLLISILWTGLGFSEAARLYYRYNIEREVYTWTECLVWGLASWYLWGLLSPLIVWITRRAGFARINWWRSLSIHIAAAVALSLVQLSLDAVVSYGADLLLFQIPDAPITPLGKQLGYYVRFMLQRGILTYFLIAFVAYALIYYRQYRHEVVYRARLEVALAEARLEALKRQLHPHFLFNTLNSISALVHTDPKATEWMIARLSDLLRATLDVADRQEISLKQELRFVDSYLDIQKVRYGDRLRVRRDVAPDVLDAIVPNLVLQPLVENAIAHGICKRIEGGTVSLLAERKGDYLLLTVADDGPGPASDWKSRQAAGHGLTSIRERLEQLYGSRHQFNIQAGPDSGTVVNMSIPYRTDDPSTEQL